MRVQSNENIGDRLRPAKCTYSDFPITCAISGWLGTQSNGLGIPAGVSGCELESFGGIERVSSCSHWRLSAHGFEFGSLWGS